MSKIEDLMPHFTQLKASLAERRGPDASSRTVAQHMAATKDEQLDALAVAMRQTMEKLQTANQELYDCYDNGVINSTEAEIKNELAKLETLCSERHLLRKQNKGLDIQIRAICQDGHYDQELVKVREQQ